MVAVPGTATTLAMLHQEPEETSDEEKLKSVEKQAEGVAEVLFFVSMGLLMFVLFWLLLPAMCFCIPACPGYKHLEAKREAEERRLYGDEAGAKREASSSEKHINPGQSRVGCV